MAIGVGRHSGTPARSLVCVALFSAALLSGCHNDKTTAANGKWDAADLGPDPFVTNYGTCFSRARAPAPWKPHQTIADIGVFGWSALPWDFGFIGPVRIFGVTETGKKDFEQNSIYVELVELSPAAALPQRAIDLIYDRGYQPVTEESPAAGFTVYRSHGPIELPDFLLVSENQRVAAECTGHPAEWPNPTCRIYILGPERGLYIIAQVPSRAAPALSRIAADVEHLIGALEVPCPAGATPTFRYDAGHVYLPAAP